MEHNKQEAENFPVALKLLPSKYRKKLLAFYSYARLVDDLGDEYSGDRLAALDWAEKQLSEPTHNIFTQLHDVFKELENGSQDIYAPFVKLIEANRLDQEKYIYETYQELDKYCELSANPVGHIVLRIFGMDSLEITQYSDSVCTGLQILEHLQDMGEDFERGKIYLPATELLEHGVKPKDIASSQKAGKATPELCNLVLANLEKVRERLGAGQFLVAELKGFWAKLAISGYVSGGNLAVAALEAVGGDIFHPKATKHKSVFNKLFRMPWIFKLLVSRKPN